MSKSNNVHTEASSENISQIVEDSSEEVVDEEHLEKYVTDPPIPPNKQTLYEVVFFVRYDNNNRPAVHDISEYFNNYGNVHHVNAPDGKSYAFVFMETLNTLAKYSRTFYTIFQIIKEMDPEIKFMITVASTKRGGKKGYQHNQQNRQVSPNSQPFNQKYNQQNRQVSPNSQSFNQNYNQQNRPVSPNSQPYQNQRYSPNCPDRRIDQTYQNRQNSPNRRIDQTYQNQRYSPNWPDRSTDQKQSNQRYSPNWPDRRNNTNNLRLLPRETNE
jgi:hypothetical protein